MIAMKELTLRGARDNGQTPRSRFQSRPRPRIRPVLTALRVDIAYLLGDGVAQYMSLALLPIIFSIAFRGPAFLGIFGYGYSYRLGVIVAAFSFPVLLVTLVFIDARNGHRLRGMETVTRRHQVVARYLLGLVTAVLTAAMTLLLDWIQLWLDPAWPFAANLWAVFIAAVGTLLVVAVWVPLGYGFDSVTGVQFGLIGLYLIMLIAVTTWEALPKGFTGLVARTAGSMAACPWLTVPVLAGLGVAALALSCTVSVRMAESKEW